jgi:hypothetical protein
MYLGQMERYFIPTDFSIFTLIMGIEFSKFQRERSFVLQIIPVDNLKIENVAEKSVGTKYKGERVE